MNGPFSELSGSEIEALSSVIAEVNMLRANGSEQSSIATEDALRYLRAAKYNSTRAIEIYKNYQKNRELYGLDEIKPYREPLNSEIASGKIQILGTSDDEDSPILLFMGSKHDSKYSKMDAAMQLLFHTLDQVSNNDSAQNKGIVFLLDLRECSQDPKYLRNFISVLLHGYPLLLKMVYVVGAPMWVKPILLTFRQINKIKFVSVAELSQHFSDHQLPTSLGGKFHPHTDPLPVSPGNAPPRPKLPRQQSHPEQLCEVKVPGGERARLNPVTSPDHRGRSHSGSAADRAHLRPLQPMIPPSQKAPPSSHRHNSPPLPTTSDPDSKPQGEGSAAPFCAKNKLQKLRHMFQGKSEEETPPTAPLKPPNVVTAGAARKTTPPDSSHPGLEKSGAVGSNEQPLTRSQATPPSVGKVGGVGVASRIKNFEKVTEGGRGGAAFGSRTKSVDNERGVAQRSHGRGGRTTQALVAVQIGGEGDRGREKGVREEEVAKKRREEEMRRLRSEEDRQQRERRTKEQPTKKSLMDDYENVDLGPPSLPKTTPTSKTSEATPMGRRQGVEPGRENSAGFALHYTKKGRRSPDHAKAGWGNSTHPNWEQIKEARPRDARVGVASSSGPSPKRHQYENITILTEKGPVPYPMEVSSSEEDSEDFSGDEDPAPQEVIYENFGVDSGNHQMTAEEMERHLATKEMRGISAEYLRIKNEPLAHPHVACKLLCNIPKNRYKDVVCYDNSRVVLETLPGVEGSDYIHANFVSSHKKPKAFILTQGPTKKTLVDFWRMVWEQQVHVIVMTTKCVELGRHKCTQYWPDEGVVKYGNVTVTVSKLQQSESYELRTMNISCSGSDRAVRHFQFLAWPDYGVPTSGSAVLDLISAVRDATATTRPAKPSASSTAEQQRVIVHCSAGVGRSGAFCVINNCIDEFRERGTVNVQGAVRALRLQRAYAIQTDEQYDFCYRTILHFMKSHAN